jgi:tRNA dimethylallyltransferase
MIQTTLIGLGGQTASGKSEMAIDLAKKLGDCWIISCDSRQIYKYLDLGTGKIPGKWDAIVYKNQLVHTFLYKDIPHFFIDTIHPSQQYTLADFLVSFAHFVHTHTLPKYLILCGGTGLYIKAIIENYSISQIKPEYKDDYEMLKKSLQSKSLEGLQLQFGALPNKKDLNDSDIHNPRRLVNHILNHHSTVSHWEIPIVLPEFEKTYNFAIQADQPTLQQRIHQRILDRINNGMIDEIESLSYLGSERLLSLGLEYRITHLYLLGQLSYQEYIKKLTIDSINYAQKQLTWLNKQPLTWITNANQISDQIT